MQMIIVNSTRSLTFQVPLNQTYSSLFISLYSSKATEVTVKVVMETSSSDNTSSLTIPVLLGIGSLVLVGVFGVLAGLSLFLLKRRMANNATFAVVPVTEQGMLPEQIEALHPSHLYTGGSESCSICLEKLHPDCQVRTLVCGHIYHTPCIDSWLSHSHVPAT